MTRKEEILAEIKFLESEFAYVKEQYKGRMKSYKRQLKKTNKN